MTGLSLAAVRRPHGTALVDERGTLTWSEVEARANAVAVGLASLTEEPLETVAILCRNHRGFVEALSATARIGADALLLNTGFSGPQLTDVLQREGAQVVVYDEEFAPLLDQAREQLDGLVEVVAWTDERLGHHDGGRPDRGPPRRRTRSADAHRAHHPADLRHDRHPQGRPPVRGRGSRCPRGDARPDPVACRADHRGRRADVPRLGVRPAGDLRDPDLHRRDAPSLRPRGHARAGRPLPRQRVGRRARDAGTHRRAARRGARVARADARSAS